MLLDRERKATKWQRWAACVALLAAPALTVSALAWADDSADEAPKRPTKEQMSEAREIYGAFRELYDALQKEGADRDKASGAKIPDRPAKTHQSPTIDSAQLDQMLEKTLADAKVNPARLTTDEEFVRRVYLDVTGKLPSPDQFANFVRSKDKHKREKLIEKLLESPASAANLARYWVDVIRYHAANTNIAQVRYPALEQWLTEKFAQNQPWDEIAAELITATGRNDQNGATVFALAQMAQPVEMAGEVSRVFMGVQIQCAQCHDHPNDPWKREQFHQFAAFFAGTRARRATAPQMKDGQVVRLPAFEVVAQGRARYSMPDKADPQKQIPVAPKFFLASSKDPLPDSLTALERRKLVASYVTGQDNPWFAKAFVNRVWYSLMGEGFYNPVDDMGPTRSPNAPEVLDELASQWQQGGYDVRWLLKTVLSTKAYQRESRATNTASGRTPFAANCPSRLRADQILDSLVQALDLKMSGPPGGAMGKAATKKAAGLGPQALRNNPRAALGFLFGVDPSTPNDDVLGTIPQALFLMNDPRINKAMEANKGTVLGEILMSTPDNRVALEALYLRVLARRPSSKEVSTCGRYLDMVGDRGEGFEDILWSLVNSTEFLSRR